MNIDARQCRDQDRAGKTGITFTSLDDLLRFMNIVQRRYRPELEIWDEPEAGEHSFVGRLVVFLPTKDIPRLVKAVRDYAAWLEDHP